jgi:uncharacterized membrane protein
MPRNPAVYALAIGLVLAGSSRMSAQSEAFATIEYPGARATWAWQNNNRGDIVGQFTDARGSTHGFLRRGGQFVAIDVPGAIRTVAQAINARGDIAGAYVTPDGNTHAFTLRHGVFRTVDFPGADVTLAYGIDNDGNIAGMYMLPDDTIHYGFVAFASGGFITLDYPAPYAMACALGMNNHVVTGHILEPGGAYRGYVWADGSFTMVDVPGATSGQLYDGVAGMSLSGDIAGNYTDSTSKQKGYFLREGRFRTVDVPGSVRTRILGINDHGEIVGMYADADGVTRGFLTRVSPSAR